MRHGVVLLAWWFLATSATASLSTAPLTTVGPFYSEATCEAFALVLKQSSAGRPVTRCWSDGKP